MASGCTNNPYPRSDWHKPIIYWSLGEDPKTLDPSVAYTISDGEIVMNIYDTFFQYQYLKRNPLELVLSMGAKMPTRRPYDVSVNEPQLDAKGTPVKDASGKPVMKKVIKHGEIWSCTIKKGIRFWDDPCFPGGKGREATAADFVYAFKRMADPSVTCPIQNYVFPHVLGMQEFSDRETAKQKTQGKNYRCDLSQPVSGVYVDAKDPYTFHIILKDKYPQLQYLMAMGFTAAIPYEAVDYYNYTHFHNEFRKHPVGTGAYYLKEWNPKQRLVLQQNPYYHTDVYPSEGSPGDRKLGLLTDAGKPLPLTPTIVYNIIAESIPGWTLFQQGYLDSYGVTREAFDKIITQEGALTPDMMAKGISLTKTVGMDVEYFCFNMEDPVVGGYDAKHQKLRQALSLAIDTPEFLDIILNGRGIPAQSALPPDIYGYDPSYRDPYRNTNLDRAKQLLAEAGYPDGRDAQGNQLEIFYDNAATTPSELQATQLVARQLERLGIKVTLRGTIYAVFQDRVNNGQYQFTSWGWVADYPDPENFYLLFASENKGPGPNAARYSRPAFDDLYHKMAAMDNGPQRLQLIAQMRTMIQNDCPWIFNYHSQDYSLRYSWLKNSKAHPVALNTAKYIRIDPELRYSKRQEWNHPRYWALALVAVFLAAGSLPAMYIVYRRRHTTARSWSRTLVRRYESRS